MVKRIALAVLTLCLASTVICQSADDDEVGGTYPGYPHTFYSGNFIINIHTDSVIHYVFFPSLKDKTKDPVVLWLAGGPGCSSLLSCFHENGPFTFKPGTKNLQINPQTWNNRANLLYLELPAGVGYSQGPQDQQISDDDVVDAATISLRAFFARFPAYRKNDLYLAGHGYGGVFATKIAQFIVKQNLDPYGYYDDKFKLKGIMMGNPCIGADECHAGLTSKSSIYHYEYLYHRGFFTAKVYNQFRGACTLNYQSQPCYTLRVQMDKYFNETNTSPYNIYDKCWKTRNDTDFEDLQYINTGCEDNAGVISYLNSEEFKRNWNIAAKKEWTPCNNKIIEEYLDSNNVEDILPFLIKNNLRIWIYSGDLDSYVPIIGTKKWIDRLRHSLNMPLKRTWREWWVPGRHKHEDQVGGFIWQLRDLTFVTVKGAGFRAGYDQPQAMSEVLNGFLDGKTLPYKSP